MKQKNNSVRNHDVIFVVIVLSFLTFVLNGCTTDADDSFDAAAVCPAEGTNMYGMSNRGTFIDERDGQEYRYTTIGDQVWMAQNLNYKTYYSMLHETKYKDCTECGLWYNLGINLPNRDIIDSVCPKGWKVPTEEDWNVLLSTLKNIPTAQEALLSEEASDEHKFPNECGFSGIEAGAILAPKSIPTHKRQSEVGFWVGSIFWWTQKVTRPDFMEYINFQLSTSSIEFGEDENCFFYTLRCLME